MPKDKKNKVAKKKKDTYKPSVATKKWLKTLKKGHMVKSIEFESSNTYIRDVQDSREAYCLKGKKHKAISTEHIDYKKNTGVSFGGRYYIVKPSKKELDEFKKEQARKKRKQRKEDKEYEAREKIDESFGEFMDLFMGCYQSRKLTLETFENLTKCLKKEVKKQGIDLKEVKKLSRSRFGHMGFGHMGFGLWGY